MANVQLSNVGHSYGFDLSTQRSHALSPIDITFSDGRAYALLGPSGCGKTTLLNIISGLLKPSEGRVLINGKDVTGLGPKDRQIAQVFQFPVVYDTMTVRQNLEFPLFNKRMHPSEVRDQVDDVAQKLGIVPHLDVKARNLGAELKQIIALGRGLVRRDMSAILFDEPLTVIDPSLKWELRSTIKGLHSRFSHTMIYVTHDQIEAMAFADTVLVMNEGKVLQVGSPQELYSDPAHRFVGHFIGSPGMNFIPARVESGRVIIGSATALPASFQPPALPFDEIGIRPEYLFICKLAEADIEIRPTKLRFLGESYILQAEFEGRQVCVRLANPITDLSEKVGVKLSAPHLRYFHSGIRVYGSKVP